MQQTDLCSLLLGNHISIKYSVLIGYPVSAWVPAQACYTAVSCSFWLLGNYIIPSATTPLCILEGNWLLLLLVLLLGTSLGLLLCCFPEGFSGGREGKGSGRYAGN